MLVAVAFLVTIMLSLLIIFSSDSGLLAVRSLRDERDRLRDEVLRLESEKLELQRQIERLQRADSFIIEEEARRKGMVREGEEVYRLRYEEQADSSADGASKQSSRRR